MEERSHWEKNNHHRTDDHDYPQHDQDSCQSHEHTNLEHMYEELRRTMEEWTQTWESTINHIIEDRMCHYNPQFRQGSGQTALAQSRALPPAYLRDPTFIAAKALLNQFEESKRKLNIALSLLGQSHSGTDNYGNHHGGAANQGNQQHQEGTWDNQQQQSHW